MMRKPTTLIVSFVAALITAVSPAYSQRTSRIGWTRHQFTFQQCYDPWVTITGKGTAIFTALDISKTAGGLRVYRSADGGQTWPDKFLSFGKGHDHQTLALDTTNGKFGGSIYLVSSVRTVDEAKNVRSKVFVARHF